MLDEEKRWEQVRAYMDRMSASEKALVRQHFYMLTKGNDIEYSSSAEAEDMLFRFETAWSMCAAWINPPIPKRASHDT